jgi:hypothetical protein
MKCNARSATIQGLVGRQKAPEHRALTGVAQVSNAAKKSRLLNRAVRE